MNDITYYKICIPNSLAFDSLSI
ncbi:hypothetical protein F383_34860 [Gossypium arboreum]|uniref:Uncharacterized protein n=1 Tax=Gossypium arboreum TaxID=29729 RepID=A0A0B0NAD3_GOSAR|nr:hypothetical protein F383_34860 [Gossypium arboreum]